MTEREFYISIIPDIAELIVYLKRMSKEEQKQIEDEMKKAYKDNPVAYKFMKKMWITINNCLKEGIK